MQQKEVWKPITGYDGIYEVSNIGRIRNAKYNRMRRTHEVRGGYIGILLMKDGSAKSYMVHRLVYQEFVSPIPDGYVVHHIDKNRTNNSVENLKAMSNYEHNSMHKKGVKIPKHVPTGEEIERIKEKSSKPVVQLSTDGEVIAIFPSQIEAKRQTGIDNRDICKCCQGKRPHAGHYRWKYLNESDNL